MPTIDGNACPLSTFYYPLENKCQFCQPHSSSYRLGSVTCTCNAGYTQSGANVTLLCKACPAGYTSIIGASECSLCPRGRFSPVEGSGDCSICIAGSISEYSGSTGCVLCPVGQYSPSSGSSNCQVVPAGYFSSLTGSTGYQQCDQGTYSEEAGQSSCVKCPSGTVTAFFASKSMKDCVSPRLNFMAGYICIVVAAIMSFVYIVCDRFDRLSFDRQERHVLPNAKELMSISKTLTSEIAKMIRLRRLPKSGEYSPRAKMALLISFSIVMLFVAIVSVFLSLLRRIFFDVLVAWKSLHLGSLTIMFSKYLDLLKEFTSALGVPILVIQILLFPLYLLCVLFDSANFNILYQLLNVTCQGAQAPIELFIDSLALGIAVLFIKSNYGVLWSVSLREMNRFLFIKYWLEGKKLFSGDFVLSWFSFFLTTSNPFVTMLRFFLSYVSLTSFFEHNHVAHKFSLACVSIQGFQNQELWLVNSTSVLVWLLLFPMLYMLSEVLCPNGGYTTTRNSVVPILSYHRTLGVISKANPTCDDSSIGNISISEISHELTDEILITNNDEIHGSTMLRGMSRFVWSYASLFLSVDLSLAYVINMWVHHCRKKNKPKQSLRWRQQQRRLDNLEFDRTIRRFQVQRARSRSLYRFIDYELRGRETDGKLEVKWEACQLSKLPPFYKLCILEQQELNGSLLQWAPYLCLVSASLSYFIVLTNLGHVLSSVGRKHWAIVMYKFFLFCCVCVGVWTDEIYEAYEVDQLLGDFTSNEPDEMTIQLVPLIVGFRVVLLQALGYTTTLISIIVLGMCGSPLFIFSDKMGRNIPPLLHRYSTARAAAVKREKFELFSSEHHEHSSIAIEEWIIRMRTLSIILTESRLVVAVTNTLALFVTLFLLENIPIPEMYLAILFLALLPNVLGAALTSIVYCGKRLNIRDVDFVAVHWGWLIGSERTEETSMFRVLPLKLEEKHEISSESDSSSSYLRSPLQSISSIDDDTNFSFSMKSSSSDDSENSDYYDVSMHSSDDTNCYNSSSNTSFRTLSVDSNRKTIEPLPEDEKEDLLEQ